MWRLRAFTCACAKLVKPWASTARSWRVVSVCDPVRQFNGNMRMVRFLQRPPHSYCDVDERVLDWLATGRGPARYQQETLVPEAVAMDLFEETLLKLARAIPTSARGPLLEFLKLLEKS